MKGKRSLLGGDQCPRRMGSPNGSQKSESSISSHAQGWDCDTGLCGAKNYHGNSALRDRVTFSMCIPTGILQGHGGAKTE